MGLNTPPSPVIGERSERMQQMVIRRLEDRFYFIFDTSLLLL